MSPTLGPGSHDWQLWVYDLDESEEHHDVETGTLEVRTGDDEPDPTDPTDEPIGWVSVDFHPDGDGDIDRLPVFHASAIAYPMWRVYLPWADTTAAFNIRPRGEASHPELSLETRAGVWAVDDAGYLHPDDQPDDDDDDDDDPDPDPDPEPPGDGQLIDDFDHSLSSYYQGDRRNYSITSRWGYESPSSLRHNSEDYVGGLIWSQDALPNYPSIGDRIIYYWRTSHGSNQLAFGQDDRVYHRLRFGMHDEDNFYAASVAVNNERINLAEKTPDSGWEPFAVSDCRPIPANTRMRTEVGWVEGDDGWPRLGMAVYNDETEAHIGGLPLTAPDHHGATAGGIGWNHTVFVGDCDLLTDYCYREPFEERL